MYGRVSLASRGVVAGDQPQLPAGTAAGRWGRERVGKLVLPGMQEKHLTCVLLTPAGVFEDRHCFLSLLSAFFFVFL